LFFALELKPRDDAVIERAMATPELGHYRPWIDDCARTKPYQLEDRVEPLFHEKSQSGYAAWNRLFDQTISGLRFRAGPKELAIEPALSLLQDRDGKKRKAAAEALAKTFKANERSFALITNTLAKDKEISDAGADLPTSPTPGISTTASSARWWMRWCLPCARPIQNCRTAIIA